jgi:hypothetical protein
MGEARGRGDEKSKSVDASYHTTYKQGLLPKCKEDSGRYWVNLLWSRCTRVGIGYFGKECLGIG